VRWFLVIIVAYVCLVAQTTVFRVGALALPVGGHWVRPDLLLVVGLFLALFYRPGEVFVAGWILGLVADVAGGTGRLGLLAIEFGMLLALVSAFRDSLPRTRVLGQFALALVVALVVRLAWHLAMPVLSGGWPALGYAVAGAALDAVYTAILAPYLFWFMAMFRAPLGLSAQLTPSRR
jgi:cell shape-determining protein MreD